MRVYSIEEKNYTELEDFLKKMVKCGKKILEEMEEGEFASRNRMGWRDEEDEDDYDWKVKKGRHSRY